MRVLVLSWDARAPDGGLDPQAAGLAAALAAAGDDVRLLTRLGEDLRPPQVPGVEVHAITDAPPILPTALDGALLAAQAFAARATSVGVRRLRERPVDVVHAAGWQAQPVVAALRTTHGVAASAVVTGRDVADAQTHPAVRATLEQLAVDAELLLCPTATDRRALRRALGARATVLPPGIDLPPRSPGPPPAAGPLHLVAAPGSDHRATARAVRQGSGHRRRITRSWRRRPFAVAVLDPHDVTAALRALAWGVPLLAADGPVGEVAVRSGGGLVTAPTGAAVAAALDRLAADLELAAVLGATGAAAALAHAWPQVAAAWRRAVTGATDGAATRLHAAGRAAG